MNYYMQIEKEVEENSQHMRLQCKGMHRYVIHLTVVPRIHTSLVRQTIIIQHESSCSSRDITTAKVASFVKARYIISLQHYDKLVVN